LVVRLFELEAPHFGGLLPVAQLMTRDGLRVWKVRKLRVMNETWWRTEAIDEKRT